MTGYNVPTVYWVLHQLEGADGEEVEDDGREEEETRFGVWVEVLEHEAVWGHGFSVLVCEAEVRPSEVVVEQVGGGFGEELLCVVKGFEFVEFIFDAAVEVFDGTVEAGCSDGDGGVFGLVDVLDELDEGAAFFGVEGAGEFRAPIGLDGDVLGIDAVSDEVGKDQGDEAHGVGLGGFVGEGDEGDSGGEVAQGVFVLRDLAHVDGIPEGRDVIEVFDVQLTVGEELHVFALFGEVSS